MTTPERNITCARCRFRHPASRSCEEAKRLADVARAAREVQDTLDRESTQEENMTTEQTEKTRCEVACRYGIGCRYPAKWELKSHLGGSIKVCGLHRKSFEHINNKAVLL